jgi:hypothetical protein
MRFRIGIVPPDAQDWPRIEAYLKPSADYGDLPVFNPEHAIWAVYDGPQLTGCATARLTTDGFGEVVLVGGEHAAEWIGELDTMIASWMRDEGMTRVRAYGRKGWARVLKNWAVIGAQGKMTGYERTL